jgi:hypothetical protein
MSNGILAALTRRASLTTLGAGGMAALARPFAAEARKTHKHKKKGDVNTLCKTQVEPCIAVFTEALPDPTPEDQGRIQRCCPFLGNCDVMSHIACMYGVT